MHSPRYKDLQLEQEKCSLHGSICNNLFIFVCFLTTKLVLVWTTDTYQEGLLKLTDVTGIKSCEDSFDFIFQQKMFYSKAKERIPDPKHSQSCCFPGPYKQCVCQEAEGHVSIYSHTNNLRYWLFTSINSQQAHLPSFFLFHVFQRASNLGTAKLGA